MKYVSELCVRNNLIIQIHKCVVSNAKYCICILLTKQVTRTSAQYGEKSTDTHYMYSSANRSLYGRYLMNTLLGMVYFWPR